MADLLTSGIMTLSSLFHRILGKPKQPQQQQQQQPQPQQQQQQQKHKKNSLYNDDNNPLYNNYDSDITSIKAVYVIADLEQKLQIIFHKYKTCHDDVRRKILFQWFLKYLNELNIKKNKNLRQTGKILKTINKDLITSDDLKYNDKITEKFDDYTDKLSKLNYPDIDIYEQNYMENVLDRFGIGEDESCTDLPIFDLNKVKLDKKHSDNLPEIPNSMIIPSAMKSSNFISSTKYVSFAGNQEENQLEEEEEEEEEDDHNQEPNQSD